MIFKLAKNKRSLLAIGFIFLSTVLINFSHHRWQQEDKIIEWDIKSYYAYLPATFIYQDLSLDFIHDESGKFKDLIWPIETPLKKKAIITTMGMSILYAPFFGMAHVYAKASDYEADGYSMPYRFALVFSALFYVLLGLLFLRKTLKHFFDEGVTSLVLLAVGIGTNLFYYTTYEAAMPHAFNFSLISIFVYFTLQFYQNPSYGKIGFLGLLAGLITLIRPTNILVLLFFLLWNVFSLSSFKSRITWFLDQYKMILIMAIAFILVWIPQFSYWYWVSGEIFYFTYGEAGGKFFFLNPQIKNILISYKKGWFVYTPIMFVAFIGILSLPKIKEGLFAPILIFIILNIYVLSSWWCWWFGGSFGLRAFIDCYAIMAIPLGAILHYAHSNRWLKYTLPTMVILLIGFNNFQIQQYKNSAIHYWWMNKEAYWETFLKLRPTARYWEVITIPDYDKARDGIYVDMKPE